MTLLDDMPHTVRIERMKYERDSLGGNRAVPSTISSGLSAWVQNASMVEINEYQKRDERITHKVFFPTEPGLRVGDQIVVTDGPSFVGLELKHLATADRSAGLGVLFASMCEVENNERPESFS